VRAAEASAPSPRHPVDERAESLWHEFESQDSGGRIALFLETLKDAEVMTDEMAFEMLNVLHTDAAARGDHTRFAKCAAALRERLPGVFAEGAHFYLWWLLLDALAESRQDVVPGLTLELAETAGRDIDVFNRAAETLGYHGRLDALVEALRIAWPLVNSSGNVVPWGVSEFAERGVSHEIYHYLEHTASPDAADPGLLERVQFFIDEPREGYLDQFVCELLGKSGREWQTGDFALRPPRKRRRGDWDDEPAEDTTWDQGRANLARLINEFVGYMRREHAVPFSRGELVRQELYRYFSRRNAGEIDPHPSMLEAALHPKRKLPKPPRPVHPLCPERVTLDVHLGGLMGFMNGLYHSAAALFQAMPAWLCFLETRGLIDAATHKKAAVDLLPLHADLLQVWEQFTDDPHLYRQGKAWPAVS
jgi:hypothetical protein